MNHSGKTMEKTINTEYEVGKEDVANYIKTMTNLYDDYKRLIDIYENTITGDEPELEYFNYKKALKFIRTWDIITKDIVPYNRNLIFALEACGEDYTKCLAYFNGCGKGYKNKATLQVLVCRARKEVDTIYKQKYGNA